MLCTFYRIFFERLESVVTMLCTFYRIYFFERPESVVTMLCTFYRIYFFERPESVVTMLCTFYRIYRRLCAATLIQIPAHISEILKVRDTFHFHFSQQSGFLSD